MSKMKLSEFSFDLPEELIAKYPSDNRDEARMMVVHRETGKIEHKLFKDVINYFSEGDVMIIWVTVYFWVLYVTGGVLLLSYDKLIKTSWFLAVVLLSGYWKL